ncbi:MULTISPECIES: hypothetical protein [Bacillus]|uniref:hypothetical protein n=1 Tax=Bacillus TaxID=1386 RepID=UPI000EFB15BD|nr:MULTISPECIES: hypothetical protein [Bacillus]HBO5951765.1 hypothetical protein [Pseudomonas aeruginosa]MCT6515546.1 hypothetical protein [Bacillus subtilis]MDQ8094857.1 hypothetical protein [Bacillus amyloliquefaciens]MDU0078304.1 hypothetical protein [Bacillus sp. IG2]MDU0104012.1 hypothetical protein [Bacillus sp. IS1]
MLSVFFDYVQNSGHLDFILGAVNIDGIQSKGDSNVQGTIQTIYGWVALAILVMLLAFKKFRAAFGALVVLAILSVFVYGVSNIKSLGESILRFLGLM